MSYISPVAFILTDVGLEEADIWDDWLFSTSEEDEEEDYEDVEE
jgi:hypothetical protein